MPDFRRYDFPRSRPFMSFIDVQFEKKWLLKFTLLLMYIKSRNPCFNPQKVPKSAWINFQMKAEMLKSITKTTVHSIIQIQCIRSNTIFWESGYEIWKISTREFVKICKKDALSCKWAFFCKSNRWELPIGEIFQAWKNFEGILTKSLHYYPLTEFKRIQGRHGDSLFIRAMTDYTGDNDNELSFKKEDVLYIEDTLCSGVLGVWSAWRLDLDGQKTVHGQIPSRSK